MIDLNDTGPQRPEYDADELSDKLRDRAGEWVPRLFPRGRISNDRSELRLANIDGAPPKKTGSCVITLKGDKAGSWIDFSTDDGGGPLSTLQHATGLRGAELFERAAEIVGTAKLRVLNGSGLNGSTGKKDHKHEIAFILGDCVPLAGTMGERYLASRGLDDPGCTDKGSVSNDIAA